MFNWPIPITLISKLGLLAYSGYVKENEIDEVELSCRLLANTFENPAGYVDPTEVIFRNGTYEIELDGQQLNVSSFSSLEILEVQIRQINIGKTIEEFDFNKLEKARNSTFQELKEMLNFHKYLPKDGNDLIKLYDWDISNLMLMMQSLRFPHSIFSEKVASSATAVPIFRYPTSSIERSSNNMQAMARMHSNYGPEVIINGLFLFAIEELLVQICTNPFTSPLEVDLHIKDNNLSKQKLYYQEESTIQKEDIKDNWSKAKNHVFRFSNPHFIKAMSDRDEISASILSMPLREKDLRLVGFMRDLCAAFCIYHEEAHLSRGHVFYLSQYSASITGYKTIPGRLLDKIEATGKQFVSDNELKELQSTYPFNDNVSHIMELEADYCAMIKCWQFFLVAISGNQLENPEELFLISMFSVMSQIRYVEEFHTECAENTHPESGIRIFSLLLHFCNKLVNKKDVIAPFILDDKNNMANSFLSFQELKPLIESVIDFSLAWLVNFEKSFHIEFGEDSVDDIKKDIIYLLENENVCSSQFSKSAKSRLASGYSSICSQYDSYYKKGLLKSYVSIQMSMALGESVQNAVTRKGLSISNFSYWPL